MKKLIFISLLFSILSLSVSAQKPTKAEKAAQLEQEFQQTRQLIESNHFQFELALHSTLQRSFRPASVIHAVPLGA